MMAVWRPGIALALSLGFLVANMSSAHSRVTRQMCIAEQVAKSDAVFTGKVTASVVPATKMPGLNRYVSIEVQDVLKGSIPRKVNFVVSGYSAELNPDCCEAGATHLFFARYGYDVFDEADGSFIISTHGKDTFLSTTNGGHSTFLVDHGDRVVGWPGDSACIRYPSNSTHHVYACIRQLESSPTPEKGG